MMIITARRHGEPVCRKQRLNTIDRAVGDSSQAPSSRRGIGLMSDLGFSSDSSPGNHNGTLGTAETFRELPVCIESLLCLTRQLTRGQLDPSGICPRHPRFPGCTSGPQPSNFSGLAMQQLARPEAASIRHLSPEPDANELLANIPTCYRNVSRALQQLTPRFEAWSLSWRHIPTHTSLMPRRSAHHPRAP